MLSVSAWLPALCGLLIGAAVGFAVRHARLCSFGAIEDALMGGDSRRLRVFGLALGMIEMLNERITDLEARLANK